ncbi:Threonyl/alanyl tRNA synthetase [Apiosordaria backusii]|uniref:Threonyl/alanyl tRNA synthetase n=1 Tax=Apiosordaria backusii TaxID=314023 RepID=A0AA40BNB5_9PEZI|nr:Threonyl/alanyl tRNA synthetase [Apiosordaria backusii]
MQGRARLPGLTISSPRHRSLYSSPSLNKSRSRRIFSDTFRSHLNSPTTPLQHRLFRASASKMTTPPPTELLFHHNSTLTTHPTTLLTITPFALLPEPDQSLFKSSPPLEKQNAFVLTFPSTIFHPQGGGQPSDEGTITSSSSSSGVSFTVTSVRHSLTSPSQVLHLGTFPSPDAVFRPGDEVTQAIDVKKRLYYSRLHTAGHILGSAVRHLLESHIEGFDELKASHFPDSAACEFRGLIEGKWKGPIQDKVNEFLQAKMPVEIDWWDQQDFAREGLERLILPRDGEGENVIKPEGGRGKKWRVVRIVGAEVYPCGGTHVERTDLCGEEVKVRKIGRSKGCSRVSYGVVPGLEG